MASLPPLCDVDDTIARIRMTLHHPPGPAEMVTAEADALARAVDDVLACVERYRPTTRNAVHKVPADEIVALIAIALDATP